MMLLPASAEFAALCQSQISMIAEVVGADSTAVYLAESWSEQAIPKLIPIAVYPRSGEFTRGPHPFERALPSTTFQALDSPVERLAQDHETAPIDINATNREATWMGQEPQLSAQPASANQQQANTPHRLAIPMIHEGGVFGVVVSWRTDRPWQTKERDRLEECARSLTLACVLDQRGQWLKSQLTSLNRVQTQQSDRLHELLHQLKSPLTALRTFGKLLTKRLSPEDRNQTLVINMLRESDRMQELLGYFDDTLQAADETREAASTAVPLLAPVRDNDTIIDAEAATPDSLSHFGGLLHCQPCSIDALITPLVELTQSLTEAAEMTLQVISPEADSWVHADNKALIEILNNFIDNSLKYSPPGTHVWLQWGLSHETQPNLSGIVIGDTGPGIPKADQAHIFERHFRGVQASGDHEGTGLGLAIADDLIHEMNGYIDVYSPLSELPWPLPPFIQKHHPPRWGTAFIIWLPKADATHSHPVDI